MACPTLVFTAFNSLNGLGTWGGGTKITLRQTNGFLVTYDYPSFTFLYSTSLASTISGYAAGRPNMAVSDDGYAYVWVRTTGSHFRLFRHDIPAGTSTQVYNNTASPYDSANALQGPSWNPDDNCVYEMLDPGTGTYTLNKWDSVGSLTTVDTFTRLNGFSRSDMQAFTPGSIWFDIEDGSASGYTETVRYSGGAFNHTPSTELRTPVPRDAFSVWTSHNGGEILHLDGSREATDCSLFTTGGTARVHTGYSQLTTFIYSTLSGAGTAVYAVTPSTARGWDIGMVGFPAP